MTVVCTHRRDTRRNCSAGGAAADGDGRDHARDDAQCQGAGISHCLYSSMPMRASRRTAARCWTRIMEEERRLFYVAMTRAKTRLHVYAVRERYHKKAEVSRFVWEYLGRDGDSR